MTYLQWELLWAQYGPAIEIVQTIGLGWLMFKVLTMSHNNANPPDIDADQEKDNLT